MKESLSFHYPLVTSFLLTYWLECIIFYIKIRTMSLTPSAKKALKAKAHHLEPVILIGQKGITPSLIQEIDIALEHHELMKIRVQQGDKELREQFALQIAEALNAEYIAHIGRVLVFYRKKKDIKQQ
jgi:RNA-binding protein